MALQPKFFANNIIFLKQYYIIIVECLLICTSTTYLLQKTNKIELRRLMLENVLGFAA